MEHALFATDELSGFIRAVAPVRPSKSLSEVTPKSVRGEIRDKAFAKDVNRLDITNGDDKLTSRSLRSHPIYHRKHQTNCRAHRFN